MLLSDPPSRFLLGVALSVALNSLLQPDRQAFRVLVIMRGKARIGSVALSNQRMLAV